VTTNAHGTRTRLRNQARVRDVSRLWPGDLVKISYTYKLNARAIDLLRRRGSRRNQDQGHEEACEVTAISNRAPDDTHRLNETVQCADASV
jgi:hypothetical protein